jgi:hypothetical protein
VLPWLRQMGGVGQARRLALRRPGQARRLAATVQNLSEGLWHLLFLLVDQHDIKFNIRLFLVLVDQHDIKDQGVIRLIPQRLADALELVQMPVDGCEQAISLLR